MKKKKIYYFLRPDLDYLPPVMSQLVALKEHGYEIEYVTYSLTEKSKLFLDNNKIKYNTIKEGPIVTKNIAKKIYRYFLLKKHYKKVLKSVNDDIVWLGSSETGLLFGKELSNYKYVFNIFELYDTTANFRRNIFINLARKSLVNIVPEYNRAHILKSTWKLDKLPQIIPNNPYYGNNIIKEQKNVELDNYINNGYKVILYQGVFDHERDLRPIASALAKLNDNYVFVIMGRGEAVLFQEIRDIYNDTLIIDFIDPPNHLAITKKAYIGIVVYDDSSLNTIFCAPNKIYEYSMFSKPMLARDIPGLRYTVGKYDAGICVDTYSIEEIISGIKEIEEKYNYYSNNTKNLLDSSNTFYELEKVLDFF